MAPNEQDSTLGRAVRAMTVSTKSLDRTIGLLVKLVGGLYLWALLLSMEVFDFIDIDIEPGSAASHLPESASPGIRSGRRTTRPWAESRSQLPPAEAWHMSVRTVRSVRKSP